MTLSFNDFLRWEEADQDSINVKRMYIDIAGDLIAGILLSQIVYWHLPSKRDGQTKLRVKKEGELWLAKGRDEWWDECRITPRQFDRALGILLEKGIVEKKRFRFGGSPTIHIRLIPEVLMQYIESQLGGVNSILTKGENPTLQNVKMEVDESVKTLTKITAETTSETTALNTFALDSANEYASETQKREQSKKPRNPFRSIKQEDRFDTFWEEYPRKRSKGQAEKTWIKIDPDEETFKAILEGLDNAKRSIDWQKDGGQYIPYPSTWLNAKGWEDEYEEAMSNEKTGRSFGKADGEGKKPKSNWGRFAGLIPIRDGGTGEDIGSQDSEDTAANSEAPGSPK